MPPSRAGILVVIAIAGCDIYDPNLYLQRAHVDLSSEAPSDLGAAQSSVCGRTSPATLCPGSTLFCDGFESETSTPLPLWSGTIAGGPNGSAPNAGTAVAVENSPVCLGTHALRALANGAGQQAFVFRTLANRPNPLYVRFYFYVSRFSRPFQLLGFHENGGDFSTLYVDPGAGNFVFSTNFSTATKTASHAVPMGRWMCLELATRFDATNGQITLTLDGQVVAEADGVGTEPSGRTLDTVNVGVVSTDASDTGVNEVYVDEVAASASPIGCD
jgi:hypothetical protein